MKSFEELFDEVAQQIDWEKIRKTMEFLDWKWVSVDEITVYDLIKTGEQLCKEAYDMSIKDNTTYEVSTGGFYAFYNPYNSELELYFVLESGSSYDLD